jgi:VanZ family protein
LFGRGTMLIGPRIKVLGLTFLALLLLFAALGPANLQYRSGLGWQFDHILGYFAFTLMVCVAVPRPIVVGAVMMILAATLEGLQAFTPDRHADIVAALYSMSGALAAALPSEFAARAWRRFDGGAPRLVLSQRLGVALSTLAGGIHPQG